MWLPPERDEVVVRPRAVCEDEIGAAAREAVEDGEDAVVADD